MIPSVVLSLEHAVSLRFHHLGLAVAAPEDAFRMLAALGYREGRTVFDPHQLVNLSMRHHGAMPDVEVVWPGPKPGPIDRLVRRAGPLVYHLCYSCSDVDATVSALEASGLQVVLVSPPAPAPLFDGRMVSFYAVDGFGLIELLQIEKQGATASVHQ